MVLARTFLISGVASAQVVTAFPGEQYASVSATGLVKDDSIEEVSCYEPSELTLLLVIASVIRVGQSVAQNTVSSTSGRATQMNNCAANKALAKKLFDEWVNKKNLAAIDEMVTPNYVSHEGGEDTLPWPDATTVHDVSIEVESGALSQKKVPHRN